MNIHVAAVALVVPKPLALDMFMCTIKYTYTVIVSLLTTPEPQITP